jgi:hypothetical protein
MDFEIAPFHRQQIVAMEEHSIVAVRVLFSEQEVRLNDAVNWTICRNF